MKLCKFVGSCWVGLSVACSGVQTGDAGEEDGPCVRREEAIDDWTTIPEGFTDAPADKLSPARGVWNGTLERPTGEAIALRVEFVSDDASAKAVYYDVAPGRDAVCNAPGLVISAELRLEDTESLSGTVPVQVDTLSGKLRFSSERAPGAVQTTFDVSFSRTPLGPPSLLAAAEYENSLWRGDWVWEAQVDCTGDELCSGLEQHPLGSVALSNLPEE
jgi:hypothetical protein